MCGNNPCDSSRLVFIKLCTYTLGIDFFISYFKILKIVLLSTSLPISNKTKFVTQNAANQTKISCRKTKNEIHESTGTGTMT